MGLVRAFHEEREPIQTNVQEEQCARMMKKQFAMGQRAFLGGMWVKEIVSAQATYFRKTRRRKSAKKWTVETIIQIQRMIMEMWYAPNDKLHNNEESDINKKVHATLDEAIDRI